MTLKNIPDELRQLKQSVKAARRWKHVNFRQVPCLFGNAMPKSGSHLVLQVLQGLTAVAPFRYITPNPTRTITAEGRLRPTEEIMADLKRLKSGAIGWGYLRAEPEYFQYLEQKQDLLFLFVYRDPATPRHA